MMTKSVWLLLVHGISDGYTTIFDGDIPLDAIKRNYCYPADVPIGSDPLTWEYDDERGAHVGSDGDYGEVCAIYRHDIVMGISEDDISNDARCKMNNMGAIMSAYSESKWQAGWYNGLASIFAKAWERSKDMMDDDSGFVWDLGLDDHLAEHQIRALIDCRRALGYWVTYNRETGQYERAGDATTT